jgi:hypothetical protein
MQRRPAPDPSVLSRRLKPNAGRIVHDLPGQCCQPISAKDLESTDRLTHSTARRNGSGAISRHRPPNEILLREQVSEPISTQP